MSDTDMVVKANVLREWIEGLRLVRKEHLVAALFLVMGISLIGESTGRVVIIPFIKDVVHGNALALGWIITAQGLGGVLGSLFNTRLSKLLSPAIVIAFGGIACGVTMWIEVVFPVLPVVLLAAFLAGAPVVFFFTGLYTLLQRSVADAYRGRVFGAYGTTNTLLLLIGMSLSSALTAQFGVVLMLALLGIFYFLAGVTALVLLRGVKKGSNF